MPKFIFDFEIKEYIGCGFYKEDVVRSCYAIDYEVHNEDIKIIKTEFDKKEFENRKDELEKLARLAYDKEHKYPLGELKGIREIK